MMEIIVILNAPVMNRYYYYELKFKKKMSLMCLKFMYIVK